MLLDPFLSHLVLIYVMTSRQDQEIDWCRGNLLTCLLRKRLSQTCQWQAVAVTGWELSSHLVAAILMCTKLLKIVEMWICIRSFACWSLCVPLFCIVELLFWHSRSDVVTYWLLSSCIKHHETAWYLQLYMSVGQWKKVSNVVHSVFSSWWDGFDRSIAILGMILYETLGMIANCHSMGSRMGVLHFPIGFWLVFGCLCVGLFVLYWTGEIPTWKPFPSLCQICLSWFSKNVPEHLHSSLTNSTRAIKW